MGITQPVPALADKELLARESHKKSGLPERTKHEYQANAVGLRSRSHDFKQLGSLRFLISSKACGRDRALRRKGEAIKVIRNNPKSIGGGDIAALSVYDAPGLFFLSGITVFAFQSFHANSMADLS